MDIQDQLTYFEEKHPEIYQAYSAYGRAIHEQGGPLPEKTRWLIKIAVSATEGYRNSLITHIKKALRAGCTAEEIEHTLLLVAPTAGFPRMMEALTRFRKVMETTPID